MTRRHSEILPPHTLDRDLPRDTPLPPPDSSYRRAPDCLSGILLNLQRRRYCMRTNQPAHGRLKPGGEPQIQFLLIRSDLETCLRYRVRSSQGPFSRPKLISAQMSHFPCYRGRKRHNRYSLICHKMCLVMKLHRAVCGYGIERKVSGVPVERKARLLRHLPEPQPV